MSAPRIVRVTVYPIPHLPELGSIMITRSDGRLQLLDRREPVARRFERRVLAGLVPVERRADRIVYGEPSPGREQEAAA